LDGDPRCVYDMTKHLPGHLSRPEVIKAWCGNEASEAYETKTKARKHSAATDKMLDSPSRPKWKTGLSEAQAQARLKAEGYNELPRADRRTAFKIVFEVLREPMIALLVAGGLVYLALGDLREALFLLVFAVLAVMITVIQEMRTERVLEALRDLTSPRALVIRDGGRIRIPGREVARGDTVLLAEGDRVPADAALLESDDLLVDESMLTGESVPVRKFVKFELDGERDVHPGGDDSPFVYSGSLVVRGSGIAMVTATGPTSEIGKLGQSLTFLDAEPPRLQAQMNRLVRMFGFVGAGVCVLAVVLYGALRDHWFDALLGGIALGMSMLPQEFPVVLAVFMAMGAWRISRARVLTRRAAAIETLGSATVLCTDKTGTLTENRMTITELRRADGEALRLARSTTSLPDAFRNLIRVGVLASARQPFDPMEKAFHELGLKSEPEAEQRDGDGLAFVHAYGLRPDLLAVTQVWRPANRGSKLVVASKGAPEAIAELCRFDGARLDTLNRSVSEMATDGLRVLGVAQAVSEDGALPASPREFVFEFVGLVGLADPLRESAAAAVGECRSAGIRVVMITGDYPATAAAIARQAGLDANRVMTGQALENLSEAELGRQIGAANVFARIMPDQKLRIVNALKAEGDVVAMTGDGVNDAPSLKAAHIGVAMGGRGTDVAREASALVLLDDDFGSIVKAVRLGRRIYDNLRKAVGFIFAAHVPIAGLALTPLVFGLPVLLGPIHIAFIEMVIDPVCSLVFEAEVEEDDVMRRPPRPPAEPMAPRSFIAWSLFQGVFAFVIVVGVLYVGLKRGMPVDEVRALTFFALILVIVGLILINRSFSASVWTALFRPNPALLWIVLAVAGILGLALKWPFAADLFRFGPLHPDDLALTVGAGVIVFACLDALKLFRRSGRR
jgi:P-type Ca2+ transporter type 2C